MTTQQEMKKEAVTFDEVVHLRATMSRKDYSEREARQSWMTSVEMEEMNTRCFKTAERMESGKCAKRNSTYRGLENFSARGQSKLDRTIRDCIDSVLDEQDRQYSYGIDDFSLIAKASFAHSEKCATTALRIGRLDAREAKRCHRRMSDISIKPATSPDSNDSSESSVSVVEEKVVPILKTGNVASYAKTGGNGVISLDVMC